jgi:hypothetical protein
MAKRWNAGLMVAAALAALGLAPARAAGQDVVAGGPGAPLQPYLGKWDATGSIGWHLRQVGSGFDGFKASSLYAGLSLGHYWTENLKTEVDLGTGGTARFIGLDPSLSGTPYRYGVYAHYTDADAQLAIGQVYQFFHNSLFHPFVGVGFLVHHRRVTKNRPAQDVPTGNYQYSAPVKSVSISSAADSRTVWTGEACVVFGFKGYLSERAFFRADLRLAATSELKGANPRIAFGIDF